MYKKVTSIPLKGSSSSLFNNLDILQDSLEHGSSSHKNASYLSVHKTTVNIVQQRNSNLSHKQIASKEGNTASIVTQAKWCNLSAKTVLVITHVKGVQIYDESGQLLLFFHQTADQSGASNKDRPSFCRGITCYDDKVIVGNCFGEILVIRSEKVTFSLLETVSGHVAPISALASTGEIKSETLRSIQDGNKVDLASSDDDGSISLWNIGSKIKFIGSITGLRIPCTSLCFLTGGLLCCGYYSGHIRVYDTATCDALAVIDAHAAAVTCMDAATLNTHNQTSKVITGSDDSFLRVWEISRKPSLKIKQNWFTCVKDEMICGIKFFNSTSSFGVTGYDSNEVIVFNKIS